MNAATTTLHHPAARALLALGLLAAALWAAIAGGGWPFFALGALGPDIALAGGMDRGRLNPRAVPLYNALHTYWLPLPLLAIAATGLLGHGALVLALAWAAHIAIDRALGYGLRDREGFQRAG